MKSKFAVLIILFIFIAAACGSTDASETQPESTEVSTVIEPTPLLTPAPTSDESLIKAPTETSPSAIPNETAAVTADEAPKPAETAEVEAEPHDLDQMETPANDVGAEAFTVERQPQIGVLSEQSDAPLPEPETQSVYLMIAGYEDDILYDGLVEYRDGDHVFGILEKACAESGIELNLSGSGITAYVKGIGGYREFDQGPLSGWIFKVNGQLASKGAGLYILEADDRITFYYTLDLGADAQDKP